VRTEFAAVVAICVLTACASDLYARFDDPRPEGRLSLRERSDCEDPDDSEGRWCDYPHEVRAFTQKRQNCDHFRGEPWPEGDETWERERRKDLIDAMRKHCTGTDKALARLRAKYRDDAEISKLLSAFESEIEP
jgi:hypothetical protein